MNTKKPFYYRFSDRFIFKAFIFAIACCFVSNIIFILYLTNSSFEFWQEIAPCYYGNGDFECLSDAVFKQSQYKQFLREMLGGLSAINGAICSCVFLSIFRIRKSEV